MKIPKVITIGLLVGFFTVGGRGVFAQAGVKIAILDSGSNIAYKEGISLIDGTVRDDNGHGTLIAGIIKETYPCAELYVIKVIGKDGLALSEEVIILGLQWAISKGVNIINMSLRLKDSESLHQVIRQASSRGIIIIAAAGNSASKVSILNAAYRTGNVGLSAGRPSQEVACPAKYPEVIAVGALNRYGKVYGASVKEKEVEIYCRGYKGSEAGTSIAAAYASGAIADIISKNPNFDVKELRGFIAQKGCPLLSGH